MVQSTGRAILKKTQSKNKRSQIIVPIMPISDEDLIHRLTMTKTLPFDLADYDKLVAYFYRLLPGMINENYYQSYLEPCLTSFMATWNDQKANELAEKYRELL